MSHVSWVMDTDTLVLDHYVVSADTRRPRIGIGIGPGKTGHLCISQRKYGAWGASPMAHESECVCQMSQLSRDTSLRLQLTKAAKTPHDRHTAGGPRRAADKLVATKWAFSGFSVTERNFRQTATWLDTSLALTSAPRVDSFDREVILSKRGRWQRASVAEPEVGRVQRFLEINHWRGGECLVWAVNASVFVRGILSPRT